MRPSISRSPSLSRSVQIVRSQPGRRVGHRSHFGSVPAAIAIGTGQIGPPGPAAALQNGQGGRPAETTCAPGRRTHAPAPGSTTRASCPARPRRRPRFSAISDIVLAPACASITTRRLASSQPSDITPTRNSSTRGRSSGADKLAERCGAAWLGSHPLLLPMCSPRRATGRCAQRERRPGSFPAPRW